MSTLTVATCLETYYCRYNVQSLRSFLLARLSLTGVVLVMTDRCDDEQVVAYHELPLGPDSIYDPPYEYGST
jgi:hypothetical protein